MQEKVAMIFTSNNLIWTQHSLQKLRQYRLSASRILRVLRHPVRREVGIAPKTEACMQKAGSAKHPYEIWIMYVTKSQNTKHKKFIPSAVEGQNPNRNRITIISAWRYPGVSPIHEPPPIPDEVWEELNKSD